MAHFHLPSVHISAVLVAAPWLVDRKTSDDPD
jgi:hypothetical protein